MRHSMLPVSGFISKRAIEPGQTASPGRPVFEIVNLDPVEINVGVPETDIHFVRLGQKASSRSLLCPEWFRGDSPGHQRVGRPQYPNVYDEDRGSQSRPYPPGRDGRGRQIQGDRIVDMMTLPAEAILRDPQGATVVFVYYPDAGACMPEGSRRESFTAGRSRSRAAFQAMKPSFLQGQEKMRDGIIVSVNGGKRPGRGPRPTWERRGAANESRKFSLRYPTVTLILAAMALAVGTYSFLYMPRTEDPTVTIRTGLVIALYPGATSEQVEKQVTKTLEKHIFKFPEIRKEKTFSTSRPGLVIINVELENNVKNSDVIWAKIRHEMNEARVTELPEGVRGPYRQFRFRRHRGHAHRRPRRALTAIASCVTTWTQFRMSCALFVKWASLPSMASKASKSG